MVAVWTQALFSAAEISNFFSALGVLICFISMVVYIMRIQGVQFPSSSVVHVGQPSPVQVNFRKIGIPFECFLNSDSSSGEEIEFKLTIDVECYLKVFWGVSISHLKEFIYLPWKDFSEKLENFNGLHSKKAEDKKLLEPESPNETCIIRLQKEKSCVSLGKAPRTHFPLVIILTRKELPIENDSNIGSLICVVHIWDEDCPMSTSIIYQYLKQYSGQLTQLQNDDVNDLLKRLMVDHSVFKAYIGIRDEGKEGEWRFMDKSLVKNPRWDYNGEWYRRDKNCAYIDIVGNWFHINCKNPLPFFCQIPMF